MDNYQLEIDFQSASDEEIKDWLISKKVLFVTNSIMLPGSTFVSSVRTYFEYIPIHNFYVVPGVSNNKPFYGLNAFLDLTAKFLTERVFMQYDYVIYIDEDAFITDFKSMIDDFADFISEDKYCLAGPQDGGVFCHRNHISLFFNSFISFWNMKMLRRATTAQEFIKVVNDIASHKPNEFSYFIKKLQTENPTLLRTMKEDAQRSIWKVKDYRMAQFDENGETPYAQVVKNDLNNPVEPHQVPYSNTNDTETGNFEPYYLIEEAFVLVTKKPILYLYATDYYNKDEDNEEMDNTGLTSAVFHPFTNKMYCVHTWFSRAYSKYPINKLMLEHTNRINKVILKYGKV